MSTLAQIREDTTWFLTQWGEAMTRKRLAVTYDDEGMGIEDWDSSDVAVTGDWQPLTGAEIEAEAGLEQKSEAKVIFEYDTDVLANDRLVRDGVTYRVNYVKAYEEHLSVFIYREVQQ